MPPELVFDQGLGDLLCVRTAGQVLEEAVLGSLQYGVEELRIPLVLVLGHERCGAVAATLDLLRSGAPVPGHLRLLVTRSLPPPTGPGCCQATGWTTRSGRTPPGYATRSARTRPSGRRGWRRHVRSRHGNDLPAAWGGPAARTGAPRGAAGGPHPQEGGFPQCRGRSGSLTWCA
ncbi:carbonic anhydrase [Streptomyces sp. NPDC046931]|uniref:carbonic anhydrase n=1 Tax=Streptomyces sp. NPDC046931 TaxID=3154806 RepID=UPI0033E58F04